MDCLAFSKPPRITGLPFSAHGNNAIRLCSSYRAFHPRDVFAVDTPPSVSHKSRITKHEPQLLVLFLRLGKLRFARLSLRACPVHLAGASHPLVRSALAKGAMSSPADKRPRYSLAATKRLAGFSSGHGFSHAENQFAI